MWTIGKGRACNHSVAMKVGINVCVALTVLLLSDAQVIIFRSD